MASPNFNKIKREATRIASTISSLTLLIDKVPDHFGRWVPPVKKFYREHKKLISAFGVMDKTIKASRGKLDLLGAGILKAKLQGVGLNKTMSTFGAVGAYATSKVIAGLNRMKMAAVRAKSEMAKAQRLQSLRSHEIKVAKTGARGNGVGFGGVAAGAVAAAGLSKAKDAVGGAISKGDDLARSHEITGLPIRTLAMMRDTADDLGISMESVGKSLVYMARNLTRVEKSGGPAAVALRNAKVSAEELLAMKPENQFTAIGKALAAIEDPSERLAFAFDMFGRSGPELIPLFLELNKIDPTQLGRYADALADTAEGFRETAIQGRKAKDNISTLAIGAAEEVAPLLDRFNKGAEEGNIRAVGQKIGKGLMWGVNKVIAGEAWVSKMLGLTPGLPGIGAGKISKPIHAAPKKEPVDPFWKFNSSSQSRFSMLKSMRDTKVSLKGASMSTAGFSEAKALAGRAIGGKSSKTGLALLPLRERREIASVMAAQNGKRESTGTSTYGAVKSGDRERRKAFIQQQVRQMNGVDKLVQQNQEIVNIMNEWNQ